MKIGKLIEFAVDPVFPEIVKEEGVDAAKKQCQMRIGVVVAEADDDGYLKICVTPQPSGWNYVKGEFTIHTDYCIGAEIENGNE
tara:strand:- start:573 stop:824 length:252 start_codon:yes stop_codon:yes gene_type:complete